MYSSLMPLPYSSLTSRHITLTFTSRHYEWLLIYPIIMYFYSFPSLHFFLFISLFVVLLRFFLFLPGHRDYITRCYHFGTCCYLLSTKAVGSSYPFSLFKLTSTIPALYLPHSSLLTPHSSLLTPHSFPFFAFPHIRFF